MDRIHVLLDLDGQYLLGSSGKTASQSDLADFHFFLKANQSRLRISFVTARPAVEIRALTQLIPCSKDEIHLTEHGLMAWDSRWDVSIVHASWQQFTARQRPFLVSFLESKLGLGYFNRMGGQFIPGRLCMISIAPPIGVLPQTYGKKIESILLSDGMLTDVRINVGQTIDIVPTQWDKADGLPWLDELYRWRLQPIDWHNTIWIADRISDGKTAQFIAAHGGKVSCPANADHEYQRLIAKLGGYVSNGCYHKGLTEILFELGAS